MSQAEFTKLFTYMQEHFRKIESELRTKADSARVYTALDAILKNQETDQQERPILSRQLDRHERGIEKAADKLQIL